MNWFLILDLIALQVCIILTIVVFIRRPPSILWPALGLVPIGGVLWSLGEILAQFFPVSEDIYEIWVYILYSGTTLITVSWLHFSLSFAEYINFKLPFDSPKLRVSTICIAIVIWFAILSNSFHGGFLTPHLSERNDYHILWYVIASYHYGIYLLCLLVLIYLHQAVKEKGHLTQIRIVLLATAFPLCMNGVFMTQLAFGNFDLTVFGFSVSSMLFVIAIYRYSLFSLSPFTLRSLVYSEADPYLILDSKGSVAVYSEVSLEWFGAENLNIGCNGIDLLASRFDLEKFVEGRASLQNLILTETTSFEIKTLDTENPEWFRLTSTIVRDEEEQILGIGIRMRNVTELVLRNEKIKEQASVLEGILRTVDEGITVGDTEGELIYFNKRYSDIWGINPNELSGDFSAAKAMVKKVFHSEEFYRDIARIRASEDYEKDINVQLIDGRTIRWGSRPIDLGQNQKGRIWTSKDITEELEAASSREETERKMFHAEKLSSLGIMAGGIAHEFNGLLTVILGRAELTKTLLQQNNLSTDSLSAIIASGNRAAELTGQMLSYVGQSISANERVRLRTLLEDTLDLLDTTISSDTKISVIFESDPIVVGDLAQLGRVLTNLIKNSLEALVDGKGRVDITIAESTSPLIASFSSPASHYAVLSISDNGRGIPKELIDKIFDPFVTSKFTGRGLGLAAAQGIVQAHNGVLQVESEIDSGTTFKVYLPIPSSS